MVAALLADVIFRRPADPWSWGSSQRVFFFVLVLLLVERFIELRLSARNARLAFERGGVEVGTRHFRVMSLLHTLWFVACFFETFHQPLSMGRWALAFLGAAVFTQGLRWWAISTLGPRWNVRVIFVPGEGPVTTGPYRFLRHPNYLAVILEMACVPLIAGAWRTALVFSIANAALLWVRIRAEEAALGPLYAQAFARTSRFVPGASSGGPA